MEGDGEHYFAALSYMQIKNTEKFQSTQGIDPGTSVFVGHHHCQNRVELLSRLKLRERKD